MRVVDEVESTNTTLLEQAVAGAAGGLVLAAELQTRGRGRRGRAWHAGLGGALTFSALWRFEQGAGFLAGLGLAVGVALRARAAFLGVEDAMLKWPNDVLVRHQKLAGTLVEIQGTCSAPAWPSVGVGINYRLDAFHPPAHRPGGDRPARRRVRRAIATACWVRSRRNWPRCWRRSGCTASRRCARNGRATTFTPSAR